MAFNFNQQTPLRQVIAQTSFEARCKTKKQKQRKKTSYFSLQGRKKQIIDAFDKKLY